jgi:hypothetical protein
MWWLAWLVGESFTSTDFDSKDPFFRIQWSRLTQWDLDFKNNLPDQTNTDFRIYDLVGAEPIWGENCAIDLKEYDKEGQPGNLKLCWAARPGNLVHVLKTRQYWSSHVKSLGTKTRTISSYYQTMTKIPSVSSQTSHQICNGLARATVQQCLVKANLAQQLEKSSSQQTEKRRKRRARWPFGNQT